MITQDYSGSMRTSPLTQETIKKAATLMKYFEVTAYTDYCGEHLWGYYMAESEEDLVDSGKVDDLVADCAAEWSPDYETEYEDAGYESPEDYEEAYLAGCGATILEITKEEYELALRKGVL